MGNVLAVISMKDLGVLGRGGANGKKSVGIGIVILYVLYVFSMLYSMCSPILCVFFMLYSVFSVLYSICSPILYVVSMLYSVCSFSMCSLCYSLCFQ